MSTRDVYLSVHVAANSDMFSQSEGARESQCQYMDAAGQERKSRFKFAPQNKTWQATGC